MEDKITFTLSQILFMFIIIVIIFLVATFPIMYVINKYKKEEFKSSVYAIFEAAKLEYRNQKQKNDVAQKVTFRYVNGEEAIIPSDRKLNYFGTRPNEGKILIDMNGDIALALFNGGSCAIKKLDNGKIEISKKSKDECDVKVEKKPNADTSGASYPKLANNMIPIKWHKDKWIKADSNNEEGPNKWYDYDNQMWANVALISLDKRGEYLHAQLGTEIIEEDVMAYFVWIPRYKYSLFNVGSVDMNVKTINIVFESATDKKSEGTVNNNYLTHPAFKLGDRVLDGFWVGKFETTGTPDKPTIKPNNKSLTNQNISSQFITAIKFNDPDDYGLSKINKSHVMRNIEWGAVAYLSQSIYGKSGNSIYTNFKGLEKEIYINNINVNLEGHYAPTITGCAANSLVSDVINDETCPDDNQYYTNHGVKASTTGNIYGVYDMSGGAWEYVMGVQYDDKNNDIKLGNSGFENFKIKEKDVKEYLDKYSYGVTSADLAAYNRRIMSDATGEVRGWNGDAAIFINDDNPWFIRGGTYSSGINAGIFSFSSSTGGPQPNYGFRVVIIG